MIVPTGNTKFFNDSFAGMIRVGLLIRRHPTKDPRFFYNHGPSEHDGALRVVITDNYVSVYINEDSLFEYDPHTGPLAERTDIEELERESPDEAFTAEELLELSLYEGSTDEPSAGILSGSDLVELLESGLYEKVV